MAKPQKPKKLTRKPETESYEIEVEDWETEYHFGVNKGRNRFLRNLGDVLKL